MKFRRANYFANTKVVFNRENFVPRIFQKVWYFFSSRVTSCALLFCVGGVLLGYDFATFTSSVLDSQEELAITEGWKLATIYTAPFMAAVFALLGAFTSRWLGRRPLVLAGSAIVAVGMVLNAAAVNGIMLFVGRTVSAIGLGPLITIGPLYIAEVSPAENRGKAVTMQGVSIAIGGFLSFFIAGYLGSMSWVWPLR